MRLLRETAHRPWPIPGGSWVMAQTWHDLLFAHWRVPVALVRELVPPELVIETFETDAWLGVVPFRMSGIRPRGLPPMPGLSSFPELNLRTYITHGGKPGVFFFALEAANPVAVAVARRWFHLPYFNARMSCTPLGEDIEYASERTHRDAEPALFRGRYGPTAPVELAQKGSFEHWLTERYCLYTLDQNRRVIRGEIHHAPWPLQKAHAEIELCTLPQAHGFSPLAGDPHLAFARRLDVVVWAPRVARN